MLVEVLARLGDQLVFGHVIQRFVANDALCRFGAVLLGIVFEVGDAGVRPADQHLGNAGHRVAHRREEFVFAAHLAAMLAGVVGVRLDLVGLHVFGIELKDLGALVVDPGDGVECGHFVDSAAMDESRALGASLALSQATQRSAQGSI